MFWTNRALYCQMPTTIEDRLRQRAQTYFLREMGFLLLAGGTVHTIAVSYLYGTSGWPTHDRLGYIYFIGLIQLATGGLDLLSSRLLRIERKLAFHLHLIALMLISGYFIVILPRYPDFSLAFKIAPPTYLMYHWWVAHKLRVGSRL